MAEDESISRPEDGNHLSERSFGTGQSPNSMAVGDFNGNGRLDIAVSNQFGSLSIFSNTNGGNFSASSISLGSNIVGAVTVGNFKGDGAAGLAVPVSITSVGFSACIFLSDPSADFDFLIIAGRLISPFHGL